MDLDYIQQNFRLQQFKNIAEKHQTLLIENLWETPKAYLAYLAQKTTHKNILFITAETKEEDKLFHDLTFFTQKNILEYPAWETLPSEQIAPSPDVVGERYKILHTLIETKEPIILIASLQAVLQQLIAPKTYQELFLTLHTQDTFSFTALIEKLHNMKYKQCPVVSDKGEFAVRGGIIDIYPIASVDPFRIEFWGDTIESIRTFDPIGQKSIKTLDHLEITPAKEKEILSSQKTLTTIFDYLKDNTLLIFDDLYALEDRLTLLTSTTKHFAFCTIDDLLERTSHLQKIYYTNQSIEELSEIKQISSSTIEFSMFHKSLQATRWFHPFLSIEQYFFDQLSQTTERENLFLSCFKEMSQFHFHFVCATEMERKTWQKKIEDYQIHQTTKISYLWGYLSSGFVMPDISFILLPMTDITKKYKIRRQKLRGTHRHVSNAEIHELNPGEMIVHAHNGIGKYLGLEKKINHLGNESEFLKIEYAEKSVLFVPLEQVNFVNKYIGSTDKTPKMDKLGSTHWKKVKEKTIKGILGYAKQLLEIYAKRSVAKGFAFPEDTPDMQSFEEEFPYEETEDQLYAIKMVKEKMQSIKPMDSLICGDVGYGKTEVALRAAFKACMEAHKQVAILVPTTVLAMQHFETFSQRMKNFPLTIEVLSRFRSAQEIKNILQGVANGSVDIVIGTHRLISKDVTFKELGLIIIDEEQRFGVRAKEHLKKIRTNVDCLTLTATPIPRTLYLSIIGTKDIATVNTPPQDRVPIKTILCEPNQLVVKNAILRELARGGQVYYIHNRVENIHSVANQLKVLFPQAQISVVHGKMSADAIDNIFHAFKYGKTDILVATTIIENGIDIPNANTIIIENADHFGLAELYQLRGRVGRWNKRAYAYFFVRKLHLLSEVSRKRLQALAESSGWGSGMKLAMKDLEIRGAGNILGTEQSGHVSTIGFHLYCKLLKQTLQRLQGKQQNLVIDTKLEHSFPAYLPSEYINEINLRVEIYQRLGDASSCEEVDALLEEVQDRFGKPSDPVYWLFNLAKIRIHAAKNQISLLCIKKQEMIIEKKDKNNVLRYNKPIKPITSIQSLQQQVIPQLT